MRALNSGWLEKHAEINSEIRRALRYKQCKDQVNNENNTNGQILMGPGNDWIAETVG